MDEENRRKTLSGHSELSNGDCLKDAQAEMNDTASCIAGNVPDGTEGVVKVEVDGSGGAVCLEEWDKLGVTEEVHKVFKLLQLDAKRVLKAFGAFNIYIFS